MSRRQFTMSVWRAALLAFSISAATGAASGYYQQETCFAQDQGGSAKLTKQWNATLGTWVYIVKWDDTWTCSNGMLPMCAMCYWTHAMELVGQTWITLGNQTWMSSQYGCGSVHNQPYVTTFPSVGVLTPGVTYYLSTWDGPWNPAKGDCSLASGQFEEQIWSYKFVCPPNPS